MMRVLTGLPLLLLLPLLRPALSEVVTSFKKCQEFFLRGMTPDLPGVLLGGNVQNQNRYQPICQKYNNLYRFATLYDTVNRIPVFSAYTFRGIGPTVARPKWMIEPGLDGKAVETEMRIEHPYSDKCTHQAVDWDYMGGLKTHKVNRGHMFPFSYGIDHDTKISTFTLTNIVPQKSQSNSGSWERMETKVLTYLKNNCIDNNGKVMAYVVTGAVPGNNYLNKRVNIPRFLWSAFCCFNEKLKMWLSEAHWSLNEDEPPQSKTLPGKTLTELNEELNKYYPGNSVQVFPMGCYFTSTTTTSHSPPTKGERGRKSEVKRGGIRAVVGGGIRAVVGGGIGAVGGSTHHLYLHPLHLLLYLQRRLHLHLRRSHHPLYLHHHLHLRPSHHLLYLHHHLD